MLKEKELLDKPSNSFQVTEAIQEIKSKTRLMRFRISKGRSPYSSSIDELKKMTVKDFSKVFLDEYCKRNLTPAVAKKYSSYLRDHIIPYIGNIQVQYVEYQDILDIHSKASEKRPPKGASEDTKKKIVEKTVANRVIEMLSSVFSYAQRRIKCPNNPVKHFNIEDRNDEYIRYVIMTPSNIAKFRDILHMSRIKLQNTNMFDSSKYILPQSYRRALDYTIETKACYAWRCPFR